MELDRTRIVIRERSATELLDLALRVLGLYVAPLFAAAGVFILPIALLNEVLLASIVADEISEYTIPLYVTAMAQLVYIETPIATSAVTVYLGRMMFLQDPDMRSILREIRTLMPRLLWTQFLLRGVLVAWMIGFASRTEPDVIHLLWCVVIGVGLFRMARPYINEIVLLERNPLRGENKESITVRRRSHRLHSPSSGDLFAKGVLLIPVLIGMVVSLVFTFWFIQGLLTNMWTWGHAMTRVFVPASLWIVAVYSSVLRFLNYLDLRIRREGWEVELRVRAAASEMQGMRI